MRQNSKKKTCENGQKNNGKVTNLSDQKERKQNIENEHTELKVPLNQEETEVINSDVIIRENFSRLKESNIV